MSYWLVSIAEIKIADKNSFVEIGQMEGLNVVNDLRKTKSVDNFWVQRCVSPFVDGCIQLCDLEVKVAG